MKKLVWVGSLLAAIALVVASNGPRLDRLAFATAVGGATPAVDASSPTGYADGARQLIVPEHLAESLESISSTQKLASTSGFRVTEIPWENAPHGRPLHSPSPYRWWLLLVAKVHHLVTALPLGVSIEAAALYADPTLHVLLILVLFVALSRAHGTAVGAVAALGLALIFPLQTAWLPGVPEDFGLALFLVPFSLLGLLSPLQDESDGGSTRLKRHFAFAGVAGGLGLWIHPTTFVPLLLSLVPAGLALEWMERKSAPILPWRHWYLAGSLTVFTAYLLENAPSRLGEWELRVLHPLHGLAWIGAGELVFAFAHRFRRPFPWYVFFPHALAALLAVAAFPFAMAKTGNAAWLSVDLLSYKINKLPEATMEPNLPSWFSHEKVGIDFLATLAVCLPLLAGLAALFANSPARLPRRPLLLLVVPLAAAVAFSTVQLRFWQVTSLLGVILLAFSVRHLPSLRTSGRLLWLSTLSLFALPSLVYSLAHLSSPASPTLSLPEAEALVERDLGQWLAKHSPHGADTVVLAAPRFSTSLAYYGSLRTISSLDWENKDGLSFTVRVAISTSREETYALLKNRGVTHLILPSWDPFLENYTRSASVQPGELFFVSLHRWVLPLWLRPVAYQLPGLQGFENQSVTIFEVVEEQQEGLFASRLSEYFIEMGNLEAAKATGAILKKYPADFSAQIGRAQLESVIGTPESLAAQVDSLAKRLNTPAAKSLPWDRRVSLSILLTRAHKLELLRPEIERCLRDCDLQKLKSLSTYSLFHFMSLVKYTRLSFPDSSLRDKALDLLPKEMQEKL